MIIPENYISVVGARNTISCNAKDPYTWRVILIKIGLY